MALFKCKDCSNLISDSAKFCPQCGAKIPKTKWWLWTPLAIICIVFFFAAINGPKDTTELAAMETTSCLERQGNGEWRASSGISLETFCKIKGATIGLKRACELDPSSC